MQWEEIYAFQKLLPILTRWQILNHQQIDDNTRGILYPQLIKKRRNPKGKKMRTKNKNQKLKITTKK